VFRPMSAALVALAACAPGTTGGPLQFPGAGLAAATRDPGYAQRRGAVEITVKSGFPAILDEIESGGGPILTTAMDQAGVPPEDRPARLLQLRSDIGLYATNPAALVSVLIVYGS
jgi:hypothetical protein